MFQLEWFCKHRHKGSFEFESEVEAEVKGAYVRGGACEVCGATGLGVRISVADKPKVEPVKEPEPVKEAAQPQAKKK